MSHRKPEPRNTARAARADTLQVGAHDGVLVVHANAVHSRWIGYWVECECGWIGPGFPNQALAEQAHKRHVARVVQS